MTALEQAQDAATQVDQQALLSELTRLRASNAELRARVLESEGWFAGLIDNMADGLLVFDGLAEGDFTITYANRHAGQIFGVPVADLVDNDFLRLVHPEDRDRISQRKRSTATGQDQGELTYRAIRSNGDVIWITTRSGVISRSPTDSARTRTITSVRDVTEERNRATALSDARSRIDQILNIIPGVFYQLSAPAGVEMKVAFVSGSTQDIFGFTSEQASTEGFLSSRTLVNLADARGQALRNADKNGIATLTYPVRMHDRIIWLRDTLRRIHHPDGSRDIVGFISDATAEHHKEIALRRMNWALAAQARSLSVILRAGPPEELMTRVCESIVEEPAYLLACFGVPDQSPDLPVRFAARAGTATEYLDHVTISWDPKSMFGNGPTGVAMRKGIAHIVRDTWTDPSYIAWQDRGNQYGIRSSVTVPCWSEGRVVGALLVYASEPDAFGEAELALFQRLSDEIALAMRLEDDRKRLHDAQTARKKAEENLSAAVQLGPGLLYRANILPDQVQISAIYGDPTALFPQTEWFEDGGLGLADILGTPERISMIRHFADGSTHSDDYAISDPDGATRWLRNAIRLVGRHDDVVEIVGYIAEVTQEKEQQLHRQQVTTLLTLGEMATTMAHELNQPLSSILLAAENAAYRLRKPADPREDVDRKLQKIINETQRAGKLIEHMRVFARNEPERAKPIIWHEVLGSALEILHGKLRGIQVERHVPEDLPIVMGWAIPMEQVLINLIGNAADAYHDAPPGTQRIIFVEAEASDQHILLRVKDQAGGIPPETLPRVFEPFFTTKPVGKGTGLGLAITADAVHALGGTITARNEGSGAVFEIRIPTSI